MERKKDDKDQNILVNIFGFILIAPLLILKWIGDFIISFGKISVNLVFRAYNKFAGLFSKIRPGQFLFFIPIILKWLQLVAKIAIAILSNLWAIPRFVSDIFQSLLDKIRFTPPQIKVGRPKVIFPKVILPLPKLIIKLPKFPAIQLPSNIYVVKAKYFFFGAFTFAIIFALFQIDNLVTSLPNPNTLSQRDVTATTKIYDRNGKLLYEIYADENRTPIKLAEIPKVIKDATIAIEDSEFLSHQGVSLRGVLRALYHNLTTDSLEGGSTITQQLVRSALLTPEKTLTRKIKEIVVSVWAEHEFTKEEILEMYLNQVPYGGTAWGIEAAAETYFGKSVKDLDLSEAAFLAGLPAAPTRFSPYGTHPELAKKRQGEVLDRMVALGTIKEKDAQDAKSEQLNIRRPIIPIAAPHFVMYVKDLLEQQYGAKLVERGGLRVITSLDLSLQEMAQKAVSTQIEGLRSLNVGNGAALITNPESGEILAMVGGRDYFDTNDGGNVNLTTALRQPGSSIKVVNYAAALSLGYTAASILDDSPVSFKLAGLPAYTPVNYDGQFHGRIPLRIALASSYNVPAVKVLASIGVSKMIAQGRLMGIESWITEDRYGLSLTLGGGEVTMLDMARVYGTLSTGGIKRNLTPILQITNWRSETLPLPTKKEEIRATSAEIAFILSSILSDNPARSPAFGPNSSLVIRGKTVSVKTGTSDNKRDNWTIGYTPDYVVVVWVGNNDNTPMNRELTSGVTGAAPVWNEIMTNLLKDKPDKPYPVPTAIVSMPCYGRTEYFIAGTQPKGGCPLLTTPTPTPH